METSLSKWNIKLDHIGDLLNGVCSVSVMLTIDMAESMGYSDQRCESLPGTILKDTNLPLGPQESPGYKETILIKKV